jgi:Magnesium transporter NIPA
LGPSQSSLDSLAAGHADSLFPRYGSKNMIWYLLVCSMIGGLSVSVTTGLGAAIVTTVMGDNQVGFSQVQRNLSCLTSDVAV